MSTIPADVILAAKASQKKWKIPASVCLAQWAVESGWGKHYSGKNNPFGIKGKGTIKRTREVNSKGQEYFIQAEFKDYPSMEAAFDDHGRILATLSYYAKARTLLPDPIKFAHALTGVYATDPNYGKVLESVINGSQKLKQYD